MPGRQRADIVDQHHRQADYGTIPDMGRARCFSMIPITWERASPKTASIWIAANS